jgi:transposase
MMLDSLLKGEAKPEEIAQFAQRKAKKKIPQIIEALQGHRMSDHHRKMIRYGLAHMQFLEDQMADLDRDIMEKIREAGLEPQWELIQSVPAVLETSAASILAETGADMTVFPSRQQIGSWAGMCPGNNRSAGKNKSSHTTGGNPWLRSTLTECAWGASNKKGCFLKDKFWSVTTKHAGKKGPAVIAVGHQILNLIYEVLRTGKPYKPKQEPLLEPAKKERLIRHHVRRLGKLGVKVRSGPVRRKRAIRKSEPVERS